MLAASKASFSFMGVPWRSSRSCRDIFISFSGASTVESEAVRSRGKGHSLRTPLHCAFRESNRTVDGFGSTESAPTLSPGNRAKVVTQSWEKKSSLLSALDSALQSVLHGVMRRSKWTWSSRKWMTSLFPFKLCLEGFAQVLLATAKFASWPPMA